MLSTRGSTTVPWSQLRRRGRVSASTLITITRARTRWVGDGVLLFGIAVTHLMLKTAPCVKTSNGSAATKKAAAKEQVMGLVSPAMTQRSDAATFR